MAARISVVIPTRNRRELLLRLLDGLGMQVADGIADVVVADNASEDGTREAIEDGGWPFPLTVVAIPERTRSIARNRGAAAARGEILLFLDDDMEVAPGVVAAHLRAHGEKPGGVFVGSPLPHPDIPATWPNRYLTRRWERILLRLEAGAGDLHWGLLLTGHFSIAAETFRSAGRFDEAFIAYSYEDSEFGLRLSKLGIPIRHLPQAITWHRFGESPEALARKSFEEGSSAVVFAAAHPEVVHDLDLHTLDIRRGPWLKRIVKRCLYTETAIRLLGGMMRMGDGWLPDRMLFRIVDFHLLGWRARGAASARRRP